jgi:hypothetical protein
MYFNDMEIDVKLILHANVRRVQITFLPPCSIKSCLCSHLYRHYLFIVIAWLGLFNDSFSAAKLARSNGSSMNVVAYVVGIISFF